MWRWFDLRLEAPKAISLKEAVGAMAQVALTDIELDGSPQKANLCVTPETVALVSKTQATDAVSVLLMPKQLMTSFKCYESRNLQFNLEILHRQLQLNNRHALILYGEVESKDMLGYEDPDEPGDHVIFYELENGPDRMIHSFKMPLLSWNRDAMDLRFLANQYPVRLGLSSARFCELITDMDSFGCTVHATLFENEVLFRVVNYERVFPTEPSRCETESDHGFPCALKFGIQHIKALLNAATLSEMIWIWSSDKFTLLSFPIDGLGKLFFGHYKFTTI
ncbi:uncharacterized protein LOC133714217 [Rosa rugosa]|uniref:uncharacterized protein LOC133714217 n=1 Tax=Rosa rugosa TaxID=74645 RepID=UPI002B41571F|nr:uncharacterized protein LOC133714217 [Rosa rugosa]